MYKFAFCILIVKRSCFGGTAMVVMVIVLGKLVGSFRHSDWELKASLATCHELVLVLIEREKLDSNLNLGCVYHHIMGTLLVLKLQSPNV